MIWIPLLSPISLKRICFTKMFAALLNSMCLFLTVFRYLAHYSAWYSPILEYSKPISTFFLHCLLRMKLYPSSLEVLQLDFHCFKFTLLLAQECNCVYICFFTDSISVHCAYIYCFWTDIVSISGWLHCTRENIKGAWRVKKNAGYCLLRCVYVHQQPETCIQTYSINLRLFMLIYLWSYDYTWQQWLQILPIQNWNIITDKPLLVTLCFIGKWTAKNFANYVRLIQSDDWCSLSKVHGEESWCCKYHPDCRTYGPVPGLTISSFLFSVNYLLSF